MSEATRLEQGLASVERERYALAAVVGGCVEGYRLAYPGRSFDLQLPGDELAVLGSPDLAAQLLDKLVENAVDFSAAGGGAPVRVSLRPDGGFAVLAVENRGPLLPEGVRGKLFESMVSVRGGRDGAGPHLGLAIDAANLPSGDGVAVSATFRLA